MSDDKLTEGKVTFTTASGQVSVTPSELEQIRQAVLTYLQQRELAQYAELREELQRAHGFIVDNRVAFIGGWRLEQRGQQFRLQRVPAARAPIMLIPYALLSVHQNHWQVTAWDTERIWARR